MNLKVIEGYIEDKRFIITGIAGQEITGSYSLDGLLSLSRLIHDNEPFSLYLGNDKTLHVPVELNMQLKREMFMIAKELESI